MIFVNDAVVLRVIDADTLSVRVDLGWNVGINGHVRLLGIDTPELSTAAGKQAARFVEDLLAAHGHRVSIRTHRRDPARTFSRYLADVLLPDGRDLAAVLIEAGHGQGSRV